MLNNLRNILDDINVNYIYNYIKNYELDMSLYEHEMKDNEYFQFIKQNSQFVEDNDALMAGVTIMTLDDGTEIMGIVTDALYQMLSKDAQTFVMLHEIAHIRFGHMYIEKSPELEFIADSYGVDTLGIQKSLKSLEEICELIDKKTYGKGTAIESIKERIEFIKTYGNIYNKNMICM